MKTIILATTSPRRKQLFRHLGLPFRAADSGYREVHHKHLSPSRLVRFLAEGKARALAKKYPKAVIIGADTVVSKNGKIFHKPKNRSDARRILRRLSGVSHNVYTGVCVLDAASNKKFLSVVQTRIYFRSLSQKGIADYAATGEPLDKAGGYGIQGLGAGLVKNVTGDFTNVVGLPLDAVRKLLRRAGVSV